MCADDAVGIGWKPDAQDRVHRPLHVCNGETGLALDARTIHVRLRWVADSRIGYPHTEFSLPGNPKGQTTLVAKRTHEAQLHTPSTLVVDWEDTRVEAALLV